uniref:Uncharacterized protein n=1 Tax=Candidatus Kentrum sp. LFY TaxID=2126342 RepID=A0A450W6S2_9GAMM|nr:MAG: hypothetical protein BECKLFY1418C_GA0070996_100172 [Candidatus Kentron sp. LFY]
MNKYIQFDESGNQIQALTAIRKPGSNWYKAPGGYQMGQICRLKDGKPRVLTKDDLALEKLQQDRALCVLEVKAAAKTTIEAVAPEYKQLNATSEALEKLLHGEEIDPKILAVWGWIKKIRAHSNKLEDEINASDDPASIVIDFSSIKLELPEGEK